MSAETEAYAVLATAGTVTSITGTRIYPDFVPEDKELPAIAITRTGTEYINTIHGAAPALAIATLELWCMASSRSDAESLADAARDAIAVSDFTVTGRRPEYEPEEKLFAAVITADFWE